MEGGGGHPGGGGGPRSIFFSVNLICEFKKNELIEFSRWEGGGVRIPVYD